MKSEASSDGLLEAIGETVREAGDLAASMAKRVVLDASDDSSEESQQDQWSLWRSPKDEKKGELERLVRVIKSSRDQPSKVFALLDHACKLAGEIGEAGESDDLRDGVYWASLMRQAQARATERARALVLTDLWGLLDRSPCDAKSDPEVFYVRPGADSLPCASCDGLQHDAVLTASEDDTVTFHHLAVVDPPSMMMAGVVLKAALTVIVVVACLVLHRAVGAVAACLACYSLGRRGRETKRLAVHETPFVMDKSDEANFSGRWVANKAKSDDPTEMLQHLGVPWALRVAIAKAPNVKSIAHSGCVWLEESETLVSKPQKLFLDGTEQTETHPLDGTYVKIRSRALDDVVVSRFEYECGHVAIVTRRLEDQTYVVQNELHLATGTKIVTTTYFDRLDSPYPALPGFRAVPLRAELHNKPATTKTRRDDHLAAPSSSVSRKGDVVPPPPPPPPPGEERRSGGAASPPHPEIST